MFTTPRAFNAELPTLHSGATATTDPFTGSSEFRSLGEAGVGVQNKPNMVKAISEQLNALSVPRGCDASESRHDVAALFSACQRGHFKEV